MLWDVFSIVVDYSFIGIKAIILSNSINCNFYTYYKQSTKYEIAWYLNVFKLENLHAGVAIFGFRVYLTTQMHGGI